MIICLLMNKFHLLNVWVLLYFILLDIEYTLVELYKQPVVPPPHGGQTPPPPPSVSWFLLSGHISARILFEKGKILEL